MDILDYVEIMVDVILNAVPKLWFQIVAAMFSKVIYSNSVLYIINAGIDW